MFAPDSGTRMRTRNNTAQWLLADLDVKAMHDVRNHGQVFNDRDWPQQCEKS